MTVNTVVGQDAALCWMGMGDHAQIATVWAALTIVRNFVAETLTALPYASWMKAAVGTMSIGAAHLGVSVESEFLTA